MTAPVVQFVHFSGRGFVFVEKDSDGDSDDDVTEDGGANGPADDHIGLKRQKKQEDERDRAAVGDPLSPGFNVGLTVWLQLAQH